ncbi:MAG: hypothetical protein ACOCVL_03235, partial [Candidatus Sumerlaeota bacterium]
NCLFALGIVSTRMIIAQTAPIKKQNRPERAGKVDAVEGPYYFGSNYLAGTVIDAPDVVSGALVRKHNVT